MNVVQQIDAHRSIRRFSASNVGEDVLSKILAAAGRASTGGSMQLYSIIVTTDAARREALSAVHLGAEIFRSAPVVLTFCVDTYRLGRWLELQGEASGLDNPWGFAMGFSDALLAAQNALLTAESLGLGGCFQGSTFVSAPLLVRFFGCPAGVVPVATLVLGYPSDDAERGTRLPTEAVVHREVYQAPSDRDLESSYAEHAKATFDRFRAVPYVAALAEAAGVDNLAGYIARMKYPGDLLEVAGAYFMAAVERQGFCTDLQLARIRALRKVGDSEEMRSLSPIRQFIFAMALTSGRLDDLLDATPSHLESQLFAFLSAREPAAVDDLAARGMHDAELRGRVYHLFEDFAKTMRT